jgi:aminoglycoside phosphotransferase (APT) family kinase protein
MANTGGVYRVTGTAALRGRTAAWSMVLKVLVPLPAPAGPGAGWRREADAYASGLLAALPSGLAAPRCFGIEEAGADEPQAATVRLWLEDLAVGGTHGPPFTPAQYRQLGRGLGALAGAAAVRPALPAYPWLLRGHARQGVAGGARRLAALDGLRDHPLVRRGWPADVLERVLRAYAESDALLAALEALPQSLCHQDAVPRNLFLRPGGPGAEAVAIDWALVGVGPVGRDLAYLVAGGVHSFDLPPEGLPAAEAAALEGYAEGLASQGWAGDPRDVRLGYLLSLGLRYGILPTPLMATDEALRRQAERSFGRPAEELVDVFREEQRFCLDRLEEARTLLRA